MDAAPAISPNAAINLGMDHRNAPRANRHGHTRETIPRSDQRDAPLPIGNVARNAAMTDTRACRAFIGDRTALQLVRGPWSSAFSTIAKAHKAIGNRQPATRTARNSCHPVRQVLRVSRQLPPYRRQGRECGRPCGRWKNGGKSGSPSCFHSVP